MLGVVEYKQGVDRARITYRRIAGLETLWMTLWPPEEQRAPKWIRRRRRSWARFQSAGVGRVLLPEGVTVEALPPGFAPVDVLRFYRAHSDMLALACLARQGKAPEHACVALYGARLCPELRETARRLCPLVRYIAVHVPREGARYAAWLHRAYGMPVGLAERADAAVCFAPVLPREAAAAVYLTEEGVGLGGLRFEAPGLDLPKPYRAQLLSVLWEQGRVSRDALRVK